MKALYPSTEFAKHNRRVILRCEDCGHKEVLDPQLVIFIFGADFDFFDGFSEVRSRLNCSQCGAPHPSPHFHNPDQKHFEPVSCDGALGGVTLTSRCTNIPAVSKSASIVRAAVAVLRRV